MDTRTDTAPAEAAKADGARFRTVPLDEPILRGEEKVTSVRLRKPGPGELRGLQLAQLLNLDVSSVIKVVPRISDPMLTEQEVAGMDSADFTALATELCSFFLSRKVRSEAGLDG